MKPNFRRGNSSGILLLTIIEGEERQNCRVGPLPVSFEIEKVDERRAAGPLVDADRQIDVGRGLVDGEEIRIVQGQITLDTPEENSSGAIFFCPTDFF